MKEKKNRKLILSGLLFVFGIGCISFSTKTYFSSDKERNVVIEENDYNLKNNILAFHVEQEDGSYQEQSDMPGDGYVLNEEMSSCTNGVTPKWENNGLFLDSLTKSGTSCYLIFDRKNTTPSEDTLAKLNITNVKSGTPDFTVVATGAETEANNGIFETDDPMYGTNAKTYYWRGAATTNHVIFANKCWRIVRINGDGTIRLIYNGTVLTGNKCTGNGSYSGSIAKTNQTYSINDSTYNNSSYVGWTYTVGSQRPSTAVPQTSGTASGIKTATEDWFNDNANFTDAQRAKVVEGKFCNDRRTKGNATWVQNGSSTQYYAAYARIAEGTKTPSLDCANGDIYHLKAGAITADEVQFAGASYTTTNKSYYLYNGQYYWTMSPNQWYSPSHAYVFAVYDNGYLNDGNVAGTDGMRPVINLDSNVTFNSGSDGTQDNPYIVQ